MLVVRTHSRPSCSKSGELVARATLRHLSTWQFILQIGGPPVTTASPLRIMLFCFDFAGSGISEGEYISLGWFERDDLATCIEHLRSTGRVTRIALWGRSMGAFTAILHADRDPSIAGLVLDSPFVSLRDLATELAGRRAVRH